MGRDSPPTEELETIAITEDGGVTKTVIKEGKGSMPSLYASCLGDHLAETMDLRCIDTVAYVTSINVGNAYITCRKGSTPS